VEVGDLEEAVGTLVPLVERELRVREIMAQEQAVDLILAVGVAVAEVLGHQMAALGQDSQTA
jgi:hypothetical protein